jgi:hypothetical protein
MVAADEAPRCQPAYVLEECRAHRHVLEHLHRLVIQEAGGIRHNLGQLAPGYIIPRSESAVGVAIDDAPAGQAADILVEGAPRR